MSAVVFPSPPRLKTVGVVAALCGVPVHRVCYVLQTRPYIRPAAYAGTARLYDCRAVAMVRHELNAIDARRADRQGGSR